MLIVAARSELREADPDAYVGLLLAIGAGLRKGEIDALRWDQVDFGRQILRLEVSEHGDLKTEESADAVEIDEALAEELRSRMRHARGPFDKPTISFDYAMIAKGFAVADPSSKSGSLKRPAKAVFEQYRHHFESAVARKRLFDALQRITNRFVATSVYSQAIAAREDEAPSVPDILWDESLLPGTIAPNLMRQCMLDRSMLQHFLVALFQHFGRFHQKGSMGRRKIIAAQVATVGGWKPQIHAQALVYTGDINLGQHDNELERKMAFTNQANTVGRSLRRMRRSVRKSAGP